MFKNYKLSHYYYMIQKRFITLVDKLFITTSIFLIVYAWINFFLHNLITTFVLSLIFTSAITFLLTFFVNKKKVKHETLAQYHKNVNDTFLAFRLLSLNQQLSLLNSILTKQFNTRVIGNSIVYKKGNSTHKIIVATDKEMINNFDLINLVRGNKNIDLIEIICNEVSHDLNRKILKNTTITLITKKNLYDDFFLKFSTYPDTTILNTKYERKNMKEILKHFFTPQKAKSYFFCGLILIFSSIILPYQKYYLIFGSTLLICSIICKIRPLFQR